MGERVDGCGEAQRKVRVALNLRVEAVVYDFLHELAYKRGVDGEFAPHALFGLPVDDVHVFFFAHA